MVFETRFRREIMITRGVRVCYERRLAGARSPRRPPPEVPCDPRSRKALCRDEAFGRGRVRLATASSERPGSRGGYWISTHLMIFTPPNAPPAFFTLSTSAGQRARL